MPSSFPLSFKVFCSLYPYHFIFFNSAIPSPFFCKRTIHFLTFPNPLSLKASGFSSWYLLSSTVCIFFRLNWLIGRLFSCSVPHNKHTVMIQVSVWYVSVSWVQLLTLLFPRQCHQTLLLGRTAFFFCCLTPAEQNYDIGDQELLAVKLALEEWHHWLEGAEHPFIIWTHHKNLTYLRTTKRLN